MKHLGMLDANKKDASGEDKNTGVVILPEVEILTDLEDKGGGDDA